MIGRGAAMHRAFIFVAFGSTLLRHLSDVEIFCPEAAPFAA
jgi:hypothetical protein